MTSAPLTYARAVALAEGGALYCDQVKGLHLQAKKNGKGWFLYYRFAGQQRRPKLGEFPSLRIDDAREAARELLRAVARGEDPSAAKAAARVAPTMADLWERYRLHIDTKNKEASNRDDAGRWRQHIEPRFGARRVADVTLEDVNAWLGALAEHSEASAMRCRALLSAMFSYAARRDVRMIAPDAHPVKGARSFRLVKRRRKVERDEWAAIGAALRDLQGEYPRHVAAILATLASGSRVSELVAAPRAAFDPRARTVTLSEHKTQRTGDDRIIHLPERVAAMVDALPDDNSMRLFGALDRWRVNDVWHMARVAAGCPDLQMRDLRRTFASVAKSRGVSVDQIGDLFSHKDPRTTLIYAHLENEAAGAAVEDTSAEIFKRLAGEK